MSKRKKNKIKHIEIPDHIWINGERWKIYQEPDVPKWTQVLGITLKDQKAWACTYPVVREIHLSKDLANKPNIRDVVIVHELLHASLPTAYKTRMGIVGPKVEERVVSYMAPGMMNAFKQLKWK